MKGPKPQPPRCAPQGTTWFGGPVDHCRVALRVFADQLDPNEVTRFIGIQPTDAERKGAKKSPEKGDKYTIPRVGRWCFETTDTECGEWDVEEVVKYVLAKFPSRPEFWKALHERYQVSLYCDLLLEAMNRGFENSPGVLGMLAERQLKLELDIYVSEPAQVAAGTQETENKP